MTTCRLDRVCEGATVTRPPRWRFASAMPVGVAGIVLGQGYSAQPCPCCRQAAAWVNGELHCLSCGCRFVPDRTFMTRLDRALGTPEANRLCANIDAFERVLRGRERAGHA